MSLHTTLGNILSGLAGQAKSSESSKGEGAASSDAVKLPEFDDLGRDFSQVLNDVHGDDTETSLSEFNELEENTGDLELIKEDELDVLDDLSTEEKELLEASDSLENENLSSRKTDGESKGDVPLGRAVSEAARTVIPEGTEASVLTLETSDIALNKVTEVLADSPRGKAISAEILGLVPLESSVLESVKGGTQETLELKPKASIQANTDISDNRIDLDINKESVKYPASTKQNGKDLLSLLPENQGITSEAPETSLSHNSLNVLENNEVEKAFDKNIETETKVLSPVAESFNPKGFALKDFASTLPSAISPAPLDLALETLQPEIKNSGESSSMKALALESLEKVSDKNIEIDLPKETAKLLESSSAKSQGAESLNSGSENSKAMEALAKTLGQVPEQTKPVLEQVLNKLNTEAEVSVQNLSSQETLPVNSVNLDDPSVRVDAKQGALSVDVISPNAEGVFAGTVESLAPVDALSRSASMNHAIAEQGKPLEGITGQVLQEATLAIKNGQKEMTLQLTPDDLGTVRIKLNSGADQVVSARLIASTAEAHDVLNRQADALQVALEAQGLRVGKIQVVLAGESLNQQSTGNQSDSSQNNTQQQVFQEMAEQQYRDGAGQGQNPQDSLDALNLVAEPVVHSELLEQDLESNVGTSSDTKTQHDNGRVSLLV